MLKKCQKILRKNGEWYLLLLPAVIYILIFSYGPMYGIQIAFKDFRSNLGIWESPWVGLKHIVRFLEYPDFLKLVGNTVMISLYGLLTFPCPLIFALMLNEIIAPRLKKTIQMITYYPYFLSTVVVCGMIQLFFSGSHSLIGNLMESLDLERIDFLTDPKYFRSVYVWTGVWQGLGWNSIIYTAALSSVPPELVEASELDGANHFQIILHVHLPTIAPTVVIMLILSAGSILSVGFEKIFLLQNPLNLDVSQVISSYVYQVGLVGGQFSYSTAIGLFNNIANVLVLVLVNSIARKVSDVSVW